MLKAHVYSIDQGIQVLYTLSLLSLLELASHTDKLILYTNYDFTHTQVTVFNSRFLSLQSFTFLSYLSFILIGRDQHYILTYLVTQLPNRQDRYRIVSKQQGKDIVNIWKEDLFTDLVQLAFRLLQRGSDGQTSNCVPQMKVWRTKI